MNEVFKYETITSLELVKQINLFREMEGNRAVLRHDTLLDIIRDEFSEEIGLQKILETPYIHPQNNQKYPMFILTYNQAKQVLVRESKAVRRAVITYVEELEQHIKQDSIHILEQRIEKIESIFYPHKHKQLLIVGNHISEFLDFYKSNEIIGVPTFIVYNDYLDYCNNRKIRAVTKTKFTQTLGRLANLHTTTTKYKGKSVRIYN